MWFEETFLQSLFERIGINNPTWITRKQTAVCCQYMVAETAVIETRFERQRHTNYNYTWYDRKVVVSYSKKNGCGTITFYPNTNEKKQLFAQHCDDRRKEILSDAARRIDRAKRFVNGKSRLSEKYTPEEYVQRLKKRKHITIRNFHRYLSNYRELNGEEKALSELRMYEYYHEYIALKECIRIVKKVAKLAE